MAVLATGLRSDLLWLTSTRLLAGIGAAWVFACGGALVAARYHAHQTLRRVATGLFFAGAGIGIAASGLVVNPIISMLGNPAWPTAWLALGVVAAIASVWPILEASRVNADLKLTHFCSERRFKSDTPPLHLPTAYTAGAVSRLAFTIPAAR